ncbi:MAG TPA: DUF6055 domain-containing protein, partial [candidate division Zixibacteria bacterium]|nr:DUF6055 domain-containing protein [candidate division Zixibacteria bacterium]
VYFVALLGYGATIFDGAGPAAWDDFKSHILLHRTFLGFPPNNDPEGSQLGALKATIAHEYFHAIQLAYDGTDDLWLHESTATYKENRVFPQTDDNFQFLQYYYNDPDTFLTASSGNKQYGSFVWPEYVTAVYGDSVMRRLWEELRFADGVTTYDIALAPHSTTIAKEFRKFTLWNFFSGDRIAPGYFTDGASYPGIVFDSPLPTPPFAGVTAAKPPDGLATNYRSLALSGAPGGVLKLDFAGVNNVSWGLNLIFRDTLGDYEVIQLSVPLSGLKSFTRYNYNKWDTLFVAPAVTSPWLNNNSYSLTATVFPHGDADASGAVNIADVTYLLAYIFTSGPEPPYDPLLGDADCSERLNINDVTYLIATIFSGGPLPCAGE